MRRSHEDLSVGAENILALFRGEDTDEAEAGAMLVAEALHVYITLHTK